MRESQQLFQNLEVGYGGPLVGSSPSVPDPGWQRNVSSLGKEGAGRPARGPPGARVGGRPTRPCPGAVPE